jgi:hypothetical protein
MLRKLSATRSRVSQFFSRIGTTAMWLWLFAWLSACSILSPPTRIAVTRTPPGEKAVQEEGVSLKTKRWEIAVQREGLKRGFFVVKSDLEWRALWPSTDAEKVPIVPYDVDFSREMLIVSSPPDPDTTASSVQTVVMTDRAVHTYVTQTALGVDCPEGSDLDAKNYDFVRVQRVDDKEVSFHVDTAFGEPCGKPPEATVACKPSSSAAPPGEKLSVPPATAVACIASILKTSRPIFDLTWTWDLLPPGSTAKINVTKGSRAVTFVPDVIGVYRLALDTSDDLQRKGTATVDVTVPPPGGPLSLQMAWTKFDSNDDPATFPRVALHALGVWSASSRPTVAWGSVKDCSVDSALPGCTTKIAGPTTLMTLEPTSAKQFAVAVHYADERVEGQPVLCVRAYRDGKLQTEACDPRVRKDDAWWDAAVIDAATGKTPETLAQERAAAAAATVAAHKAAVADAGSLAASPDAGSMAASPDAAAQ